MTTVPVDAGVGRVMMRSTTKAGKVVLTASNDELGKAEVSFTTQAFDAKDGLSKQFPSDGLYGKYLRNDLTVGGDLRDETPMAQSFVQTKRNIKIVSSKAAIDSDKTYLTYDNDESTKWQSDSNLDNSWISYTLAEDTPVDEIILKMVGFRTKAYPVEIYAGDELVWKGYTPKSLSYVRLPLKKYNKRTKDFTIRMIGQTQDGDAFGQVKEMEKQNNEAKITGRNALRILEIEFIANLK